MTRPYGIMADLHAHNWSAFAGVTGEGVNDRLAAICHEVSRCCGKVIELGGDEVVIAGDVFHTRGNVAPSVFNPIKDTFDHWAAKGITFHIIPGNHDLEGRDSHELTSAVKMLEAPGIKVYHQPTCVGDKLLMPFVPKVKDLLAQIDGCVAVIEDEGGSVSGMDLFIHTGIDGVLSGVPAHGLTADMLAEFGFKRVFAGDYHNHADMGQGVYSIGSPTHQTWSDVGTKSGWIIAFDDRIQWFASHAPAFVDITGDEDPLDLPMIVDGHFVRAKIGSATPAQIAAMRQDLLDARAKGVTIQAVPTVTPTRSTAMAGSIDRIDQAVDAYCADQCLGADVAARAIKILREVQS